ncbi:MAG: hypothetical protein J6M02_01420 [Clostridia bacterium]|nr:hypothetical protein [Clostridia bacterium]
MLSKENSEKQDSMNAVRTIDWKIYKLEEAIIFESCENLVISSCLHIGFVIKL